MKKIVFEFSQWIKEKYDQVSLKIDQINEALWRERVFINYALLFGFVLFVAQSFLSNSSTGNLVQGKEKKILVNQKRGTTSTNLVPVSRARASQLNIVDSLFLDRPDLAE